MKPLFIALSLFLLSANALFAQKYFTQEGTIRFTSHAPLKTIEAQNSNGTFLPSKLRAAPARPMYGFLK